MIELTHRVVMFYDPTNCPRSSLVPAQGIPEIGESLSKLELADPLTDIDLLGPYSHSFCSYLAFRELTRGTTAEFNLDEIRASKDLEVFAPLKGQVVIDIGAGAYARGYALAVAVGAKAYVAAELFHDDHLKTDIAAVDFKESVPAYVTDKDMRLVLRALPPNSVSVLASGINCSLFQWAAPKVDILREVGVEVPRVLHDSGVFISIDSDIYPPGLSLQSSTGVHRSIRIYRSNRT
ncbi:MAG: hypothetical protein KDD53_00835 [Bdellovibrionales bacterium]|nr:hypothetical protein [Bdellovibrionales bacterium]